MKSDNERRSCNETSSLIGWAHTRMIPESSAAYVCRSWYLTRWSHAQFMMTSSNGNIFRVTGPLCGEFTGPGEFPTQRPVTRSFDVFFDLRLNKLLSKQWWGWWFETLSWSLWRQCDVTWTRGITIKGYIVCIMNMLSFSNIHPQWYND